MVHITIAIFDNVTQLDFAGPAQVFARAPNMTTVLAATARQVRTDCGWSVLPDRLLKDVDFTDILLIPGGEGAFDAMLDYNYMTEIQRLARKAQLVTSVCTGSFVLGAGGFLTGRRATSHWASESMLEVFGAIPTRARTVRDGNVLTGGGVTAGIDFSLELVRDLEGEETARRVQLQLEYDPAPPFPDAGTPSSSASDVVERGITAAREGRLPRVLEAGRRLRHMGSATGP